MPLDISPSRDDYIYLELTPTTEFGQIFPVKPSQIRVLLKSDFFARLKHVSFSAAAAFEITLSWINQIGTGI